MSRTLEILERARTDVDEIFNWIAHRSPRGAISWYLAFTKAVDVIANDGESMGESAGR